MAHGIQQKDFVGTNNDRVWYTGSLVVPTVAPAPGIDTAVLSNGLRYDWNGTAWVLVPNSNGTITDLANGQVNINLGTGGDQNSVRPTNELTTIPGANLTNDDFIVIYDNTTGNHYRVSRSALNITTTLTGVQATGKIIGTYTNEAGAIVDIRETITTNTYNVATGVLSMTTENGTVLNVNIPLPSTVIPIADNEVDTAIRTGIVGTSLQYARADHNHPIRRQAIPAQPVVTVGGTGFVLVGTTLNGTVSDEESVTFFMTIQVTQTVSNAWNFFSIPNIAGFQRAEVTPTASYRYTGNPLNDTTNPIDQMYPNAPTMNMEWSYYFNGTGYMNVPNRTQATGYYLSFSVKYTRV